MKELISIKKLNKILIENPGKIHKNNSLALILNAEIMRLGYILSESAFNRIASLSKDDIEKIYKSTISILKQLKGDDVKYKPMYPGFPNQVMDMSNFELYFNAIVHYWSSGTWLPEFVESTKDLALEDVKLKTLGFCYDSNLQEVFNNLLSSTSSLSEEDKSFVQYFLNSNYIINVKPTFKETLCVVASYLLNNKRAINHLIDNSTDVLRIATYLSGGDISLAENTKFKSFPRYIRKELCSILNNINSEILLDSMARHRSKWVRLLHSFHASEFGFKNLESVVSKIRSSKTIETNNSKIEAGIKDLDIKKTLDSLSKNPGDFSRRICHISKKFKENPVILLQFSNCISKVSTRVLLQTKNAINNDDDYRVIFPKSKVQNLKKIPNNNTISSDFRNKINEIIESELISRFSKLPSLGKVWINPELKGCPIPSDQRNASKALVNAARGTRIPISEKNTLRFFIYWKGLDIDLTASFFDENFNYIEDISYYNLKNNFACHSGDIIRAPNGAAEFIDIDLTLVSKDKRYIVMQVFVFSGPTFKEHEICYAGWMTKDYPNKNQIFDAKTVEQKIDLSLASKTAVPVVFDLKQRKAIWCDFPANFRKGGIGYNYSNGLNQSLSVGERLEAIVKSSKPDLYNLFSLHAKARGKLVESKEEADFVFDFDGKISPFNIMEINSQFIV